MVSLEQLQNQWPAQGLLADRSWHFSPEPLRLEASQLIELQRMGPILGAFQEAQDRIYRRSAKGRIDPWIAQLLDAGKPQWIIDWQRDGSQADVTPQVIRPDILLTQEGFSITELDSVPGGLGITAWLAEVYGEVLGGTDGIIRGLQTILPTEGQIWISEESADYRPEMEWLAQRLPKASVHRAEEWAGETGYRFFELFDWESIPTLATSPHRAGLTPPIKPLFEEKLWLALLHTPGLRAIWEQELRGKHLDFLKKRIPMGWPIDPTPLPPHGALPDLNVHSWSEVGTMSQKERRLVLKISGFSELAWGSRGVHIGHDEPGEQWAQLLQKAQDHFPTQPWIMQRFTEAKLIEHPYYNETGEVALMKGRVRLCPYYFVNAGKVALGGCLATIVPADKKKIHGMKDAILVPVSMQPKDD